MNQYFEHLHKHVIIICNEDEIKDRFVPIYNKQHSDISLQEENDGVPKGIYQSIDQYRKLKEKIVRETILFEQDCHETLNILFMNTNCPKLKKIVSSQNIGFEWFVNVSTPHGITTNYRVWQECCTHFNEVFSNVNDVYLYNPIVAKTLITVFFPLYYCRKCYDLGKGRIFDINSTKQLYPSVYQQKGDLTWFINIFPQFKYDAALIQEVWDPIIHNRSIDTEKLETYWASSFHNSTVFYNIINDFYHRSDWELDKAWCKLKDSFKTHSINDPEIIVQVFASVLCMISKKICPDEGLLPKQALLWAKWYCRHYEQRINHDTVLHFDSFELYCYYENNLDSEEDKALLKDLLDFLRKRIKFYYERIRPNSNFEKLISLLKEDNTIPFRLNWHVFQFDQENIFSYQDPCSLLKMMLLSPVGLFREKLMRITINLTQSNFNSTEPYITFKRGLIVQIQKQLASSDSTIPRVERIVLAEAVKTLSANLKEIEQKNNAINSPAPTDKEPEQ